MGKREEWGKVRAILKIEFVKKGKESSIKKGIKK